MTTPAALAEHEAVAILVERPAGALAARRCASTARAWRAKPPTPIAHTAASEPPAIIASAAPRLMISKASPMACAEAVHAVQVAEFGPLAPKRMDTWPEARLMMADGMKNGEMRRGPPSRNARCSRSMVVNPPMPEAMNTPTRGAISGVIGQPRIVHRELRRGDGVLDEDVHLLDVLLVHERQRIEALHLGGKPRAECRGVELGDRPRPALTGQQAVPGGLGPDAQRGHQADARNHNSPAHYPSVADAGATRAYFFLLCDSMY